MEHYTTPLTTQELHVINMMTLSAPFVMHPVASSVLGGLNSL